MAATDRVSGDWTAILLPTPPTQGRRDRAEVLAMAQGAYNAATGVWALADIDSFQAVTGPKVNEWLVKTVGVLVTVIGGTLGGLAGWRRATPEAGLLALGGARAGRARPILRRQGAGRAGLPAGRRRGAGPGRRLGPGNVEAPGTGRGRGIAGPTGLTTRSVAGPARHSPLSIGQRGQSCPERSARSRSGMYCLSRSRTRGYPRSLGAITSRRPHPCLCCQEKGITPTPRHDSGGVGEVAEGRAELPEVKTGTDLGQGVRGDEAFLAAFGPDPSLEHGRGGGRGDPQTGVDREHPPVGRPDVITHQEPEGGGGAVRRTLATSARIISAIGSTEPRVIGTTLLPRSRAVSGQTSCSVTATTGMSFAPGVRNTQKLQGTPSTPRWIARREFSP